MSKPTVYRQFEVDGIACSLAAGMKAGRALVVFGFKPDLNQLANVTIEYPMRTLQAANKFVALADDDTIRRGIAKYQSDIEDVARRVNAALNKPYREDKGYKTRG